MKNEFYKKAYIYIMECWGKMPYYGSTNLTLEDRLDRHYRDYRRWKNGKKNFYSSFELFETGLPVSITEVEKLENIYRRDLVKIEGDYIKNNHCVNIKIPSGLSKRQYNKQYRKRNREKIKQYNKIYNEKNSEQQKLYRKNHKEHKKQYDKIYYQKNKERIIKKSNQKFNCPCGGRYTYSHKTEHLRTKKHKDWVKKKKKKVIIIKKI